MSLNNIGLGMTFTAEDLASGTIRKVRGEFEKTSEAAQGLKQKSHGPIKDLVSGTAIMTAGLGTLKGAFALADVAGAFEMAIAQVGAVSGASKEELGQLRDAAIQAGIATQYSPTQAAVGLSDLAQAGFNAKESIQLLNPVLNLAAGSLGQLSPSEAAGLASQALKAFGISADGAGVAVDQMLQAVNVFALGANELPLALGTASRGALALNQSLDETLVALGLVKNVMPSVERASTAVAVGMQKMADPDTQKKLKGIGIEVAGTDGKFRNFLDIVGDMVPKLEQMTEKQKAAWLQAAFGTEAIGGIQIIMKQMTTGIRDSTGVFRKGGDAIAYLRDQFQNAGGTAAKFSGALLDTYAGQKTLLAGSMETLGIVVGDSFAQVFRPLVEGVIAVVNMIISVFKSMSPEMKRAIATFVVVIGAVVAVVGGVMALSAAAAAAGFTFEALAAFIGTVGAVAAPLLVIGAALYGIWQAFGKEISLAANALTQLFSQGGFSGETRVALMKEENKQILDSVVQVGMWVARVQEFFSKFGDAFSAAFSGALPGIELLSKSLKQIADSVRIVKDDVLTAGAAFDSMGEAGTRVGGAFGGIAAGTLNVFAAILNAIIGFAGGLAKSLAVIVRAGPSLSESFRPAIDAFNSLLSVFGLGNVSGQMFQDVLYAIGRALGYGLGMWAAAISFLIGRFATLIGWVLRVGEVIGHWIGFVGNLLTGQWQEAWTSALNFVKSVWNLIVETIFVAVSAIGGLIQAIAQAFGKKINIDEEISKAKAALQSGTGAPGVPAPGAAVVPSPVTAAGVPAVATYEATASIANGQSMATGEQIARGLASAKVNGNVYLDGEKVGAVMSRADDAARGGYSYVGPISQ